MGLPLSRKIKEIIMKKFIVGYSYFWYYLTLPVALIVGVWAWVQHSDYSTLQLLLMASFLSLLLHQFEEYVFPGGAPPIINIATFSEMELYRHYPGNMLSSMIVNTVAHCIYLVAFFNPDWIWLGLGTMFFNCFQLLGHGFQMNKALNTWYNPGLASTLLLFVPLAVYYMYYVSVNDWATLSDWILGAVAFIGILLTSVIAPVQLLKDKNSPYKVPESQMKKFERVKQWASL